MKWKGVNDKTQVKLAVKPDHDLPKQTTIHHKQFTLFLANTLYFFVAFWAALVTLPAPFSVLATDLMTLESI